MCGDIKVDLYLGIGIDLVIVKGSKVAWFSVGIILDLAFVFPPKMMCF